VSPSPDYQPGDEGLLDECAAAVRSVDQITLLLPAAELDSAGAAAAAAAAAAATTPALPIVETVSYDGSVLARKATCATSVDTTSEIAHRPIVWDIRDIKGDVPNAPPDPFSDEYFVSSGISCVRQPEEGSRCVRIRYRQHVYRRCRPSRDVCFRSSHPRLCSSPL
jgi:hypothetical protein